VCREPWEKLEHLGVHSSLGVGKREHRNLGKRVVGLKPQGGGDDISQPQELKGTGKVGIKVLNRGKMGRTLRSVESLDNSTKSVIKKKNVQSLKDIGHVI